MFIKAALVYAMKYYYNLKCITVMAKLNFYQQLLQSIVSHDDTSENMSVKQHHGRALANESCHLFQTFSRQSEGQVTRDFCYACFQPSRFIKADSHCSQNSHHVLCDRK